ncbi:MAG: hypothetical protein ACI93R_002454 [Flavobacteriales bacterium]|jgi:hypothetical protein
MELRKGTRHEVNSAVTVKNVISGQSMGMLVNLSDDGFMIIGPEQTSEGNTYQLKLELSAEILGSNKIDLAAECLWLNLADSEEKIWTGFRIIDIAESDRSRIIELIEQLAD